MKHMLMSSASCSSGSPCLTALPKKARNLREVLLGWHLAAGTQGIFCYRYVVSEAQRILREFERSAKPRFGALRSLICPGMETQQVLKLTQPMLCCKFDSIHCGCVRLQAGLRLLMLDFISHSAVSVSSEVAPCAAAGQAGE